MDFFKKNEILELSKIMGSAYDKTNVEHQKIVKSLKNGIWEKTFYWAKQVVARLEGYTFKCDKIWHQRGWNNGEHVSIFKRYTWAKIIKKEDQKKQIYFTVGVDGNDKALICKIDYQFNDTKYLSDNQKVVCKDLIKSSPASCIEISINNLENYSWDKLISKTLSIIKKYQPLYNEVIQKVWSIKEKRVSRLIWNTNGWVFPSGRYGKSTSKHSFEAENGYGHEEWLFDISKIINGYHYGFLEPIRKQQETYTNKCFDIWLYTIDGITRKRYWIGELKNVEVIDKHQAESIKNIYRKKGWLQEMEKQIIASGANRTGFSDWGEGINLFNVRFKKESYIINDPYCDLPTNHPIYGHPRYTFVYFKDEFAFPDEKDTIFQFNPSKDEKDSPGCTGTESKTYTREPKSVEIVFLHKAISKALSTVLKNQFGKSNVKAENQLYKSTAKKIDIVVKDSDNKYIFYEIKTYNSVMTSVREALGQLIEYAFWPDKENAKELIIVTQKPHDIKALKVYFAHLRKLFNIPLYYQWFDSESNFLSDKI